MPDPTETGCAIHLGDPAVNMVSLAYDKYTGYATDTFKLAKQAVDDLQTFHVKPISFAVGWNLDESITGYQRPTAPKAPTDALQFRSPGALPEPPNAALTPVTLDAPPAAPNNPVPTIRDYPAPAPLAARPPGDEATLTPVPQPLRPDMSLPAVPTLEALQLPDAPTLDLPAFTGQRPNTAIEPPVESFAFTPEQYTSDLLARTKNRLAPMLDGGTGLPAAVAQALRDRAFEAVEDQEHQAIDQAVDEFGARGFEEPNGILNKRLSALRQNHQNQRNALSRDIYIKDEEIAIENLRWAVGQAVALESALMQGHAEYMRLSLATAQATLDMRIKVFDARVALANLDLQAYQTDAQVWREKLQGELAHLEVYRAELEALQLRGQLNEQEIKIYEHRIDAVKSLADIYRADVAAASAVVDQNKALVDMQRTRIQAYAEQVKAYTSEWDAYRSQLESNNTRAQLYGLIEQGWSTRVGAWSQTQDQKLKAQGLRISEADLSLRGWQGRLAKMQTDIDAEKARLAAVSSAFGSEVALYSAQGSVEAAASDANNRKLQVAIEQERARTSVALQNAQLAIQQLESLSQLTISRLEGIARTTSSLASASLSAVSFSAGVHSGRSESSSCGTSFSYSGSLDDSQPLP